MKRMLLAWSPPALLGALLIAGAAAGSVRTRRDAERDNKISRLERELEHARTVKPAPAAPVVSAPHEENAPAATVKPAAEPEDARVLLARDDFGSQDAALRLIAKGRLVEHLPWLLEHLRRNDNRLLRIRIAETLGALGSGQGLAALREEWAGGDLSFKRAAAQSMRELGDAAYVDAFIDEAAGHLTLPSAGMRAAAVHELGLMGGSRAELLIAQAMKDPCADVCAVARRARKNLER